MQKVFSFFLIFGLILSTTVYSAAESDPESLVVGDIVDFGHYEQDNDLANGQEAIQWLVLDVEENRVLLLSRYGLAYKPYHEKMESVRWDSCTLRAWLNGEFFSNAFSESDQDAILLTEIDNSPEQAGKYFSYIQAKNTKDKVFLLSGSEIETIPAKAEVMRKNEMQEILTDFTPTQYALDHDNVKISGNSYYWWLRGVTKSNTNLATMKTAVQAQCVNMGGANNAANVINCLGVHPAIWVYIEAIEESIVSDS